jgi:hypothetical protein
MYVDIGKRVSVFPNNKYLIFVTTFSYPESFLRAPLTARKDSGYENDVTTEQHSSQTLLYCVSKHAH